MDDVEDVETVGCVVDAAFAAKQNGWVSRS